ncbi:MAG: polysaccharide biosynthesis tyrosine autokinase [Nitrolancea sp.]
MDLNAFLAIIWRRRLVVVITAVLALIVTIVGSSLITPEYVASTTLRMGTANTGSSGWVSYDIQYTDRLMNTYRTMVVSAQTTSQVMDQLHLSDPPKISVTIPANTELMEIFVSDKNPQQAADAANAVANILVSQIESQYASLGESSLDILKQQIDQTEANLTQQRSDYDKLLQESPQNTQLINATLQSIQLNESTYSSLLQEYQQLRDATAQGASKMSVVQPASAPESPSNPNKKIIVPLGLMLGLMAGVALAFMLENFDTTMHSSDEIAKHVELPVLGRIPLSRGGRPTVFFPEKSPQEEAFRRLRTTIFALDPNSELRSLMVTSAQPSEGKSTTVANLALAIAQAGRRVIVIDGDLRKPSMHKIFRVSNSVGLSNVLTREVEIDEAIQYSMIPGVQVLAAGPASPNPAELLGLPEMTEAIEELSKQFDFVLIDAPSLQTVADASVLSLIVDRVVVVVARGLVRQEMVDSAMDELASVHCKPMGIVVSRSERTSQFHYDRIAEGQNAPGPRSPRGTSKSTIPTLRVISPKLLPVSAPQTDARTHSESLQSVEADESEPETPKRTGMLRRLHDVSRFQEKDGGTVECYDNVRRTANER